MPAKPRRVSIGPSLLGRYKVRNGYTLHVTRFIRRALRSYAVTQLRILYPTFSETRTNDQTTTKRSPAEGEVKVALQSLKTNAIQNTHTVYYYFLKEWRFFHAI